MIDSYFLQLTATHYRTGTDKVSVSVSALLSLANGMQTLTPKTEEQAAFLYMLIESAFKILSTGVNTHSMESMLRRLNADLSLAIQLSPISGGSRNGSEKN